MLLLLPPTYRLLLLLSCGETRKRRERQVFRTAGHAGRQTDRWTWRGQTGWAPGESVLCRTDRGERVGVSGGGKGAGLSPAFTFLKKAIRFSFARGDMTVFGLALGERRLTGSSCSSGSKSVASMSMATHTDRQRAPSHMEPTGNSGSR